MFVSCAGAIPYGLTPDVQLQPLTMIEEKLVALNRVHRLCFIMKPATWSWGADATTRQLCHRAHVIAFPNASVDKLLTCLPPRLSTLPEMIQVVFLTMVSTDDDVALAAAVRKMAGRSPALRVRGALIVKWAKHLRRVSG